MNSAEECRALIQHYASAIRDLMKGYANIDPKAQQACWETIEAHAKRITELCSRHMKLAAETRQ